MRAQILSRSLANGQANGELNEEFFSYQEGQHRVKRGQHHIVSNKKKKKSNGNGKLHLPEKVKIIKTKNGKRWSTASMEVEKAGDVLEVRDGLGKVVDAHIFKHPYR